MAKKLMMNNYSENGLMPIYQSFANSQTNEFNEIVIDWNLFDSVMRIKIELNLIDTNNTQWILCGRTSTSNSLSTLISKGSVRFDVGNTSTTLHSEFTPTSKIEVLYNFVESKAYCYIDNIIVEIKDIPISFNRLVLGKMLIGCGSDNVNTQAPVSSNRIRGSIYIEIYNQ